MKRMRSGQGGGRETGGSHVSEAKQREYFKKRGIEYAKKLKQKTKKYPLDWATLKSSVASAKEVCIGVSRRKVYRVRDEEGLPDGPPLYKNVSS